MSKTIKQDPKIEAAEGVVFDQTLKPGPEVDLNEATAEEVVAAIFGVPFKCPFCGKDSVLKNGHLECRNLANEFMHDSIAKIEDTEGGS